MNAVAVCWKMLPRQVVSQARLRSFRRGSAQIVGVLGLRPPFELILPAIQQLPPDSEIPRQLLHVVASLHPLHSLLLKLPAVPSPLAHVRFLSANPVSRSLQSAFIGSVSTLGFSPSKRSLHETYMVI